MSFQDGEGAQIWRHQRATDGVHAEEDMRGKPESGVDPGRTGAVMEDWHRGSSSDHNAELADKV